MGILYLNLKSHRVKSFIRARVFPLQVCVHGVILSVEPQTVMHEVRGVARGGDGGGGLGV